ncbi:TraM recognition domain-containing protein [Streptomyces sp. DSM 44915]|uniref:TraM recognition domain-containing protein n=1 Tax=Streptomyces chisholmiae TaxID=3075540 RepID=A0ABU2JTW8_9ACTN|nr:TraM recognition domain-containing protein [Streptomyces sp. DSM 44915]MDT0267638.1 TraM recognition domain-containing protein [Streptomyces sp. DSM 44915]
MIDAVDVPPEDATDIEELLDTAGTLYLLGKDCEHSSLSPLVTAITEDVLDRAEQLAVTKPHRRLAPPLVAALDEAPNIAPLPSLRQRVADGRGRGLCVVYLVQSWASAESRFGRAVARELAAITNNTLVLGGSHDVALLKDLQELCGTTDVIKTSTTHTHDHRGGPPSRSHAASQDHEPVLRAHQITRLDIAAGHALLLAGNLPPVLVELPPLNHHPDWPTIQRESPTSAPSPTTPAPGRRPSNATADTNTRPPGAPADDAPTGVAPAPHRGPPTPPPGRPGGRRRRRP